MSAGKYFVELYADRKWVQTAWGNYSEETGVRLAEPGTLQQCESGLKIARREWPKARYRIADLNGNPITKEQS